MRRCVSMHGGSPQPMTLRTAHVYRYAGARWRLVQRHADFPPRDRRADGAASAPEVR
jgi:ketosteroid isomerase-like protein